MAIFQGLLASVSDLMKLFIVDCKVEFFAGHYTTPDTQHLTWMVNRNNAVMHV